MEFEKRLYNTGEVEKILSVSRTTLWNYIRAGELKAVKIGYRWKIDGADLEQFVKNGTTKGYWARYKEEKQKGK